VIEPTPILDKWQKQTRLTTDNSLEFSRKIIKNLTQNPNEFLKIKCKLVSPKIEPLEYIDFLVLFLESDQQHQNLVASQQFDIPKLTEEFYRRQYCGLCHKQKDDFLLTNNRAK